MNSRQDIAAAQSQGKASGIRWMNRWVNPVVRFMLRSPLGTLLGRKLAVLRVTGVQSGRVYELPVQYVRTGTRVVILPAQPERKTWWRNLRRQAPVRIRLAGKEYAGHAIVVEGSRDPRKVAELLGDYLRGFRSATKSIRLAPDWQERLPGSVSAIIVVEVILDS